MDVRLYAEISLAYAKNGSFQKTSKHPYHGGNWKLTPPTPFGCPNALTIIRNNFFSPPPPDGRNLWGDCGSFLERPNSRQVR